MRAKKIIWSMPTFVHDFIVFFWGVVLVAEIDEFTGKIVLLYFQEKSVYDARIMNIKK